VLLVVDFRVNAKQQLVIEKFECIYSILCSLMNVRSKHLRSPVLPASRASEAGGMQGI